jgi:hypothetical protein
VKIHIVHTIDDGILSRLARTLADGTGWSLGTKPDGAATVNYYVPYLLYDKTFTRTMTAAWFTHREEKSPKKAGLWDRVVQSVDLRTVSTRLYQQRIDKVCGGRGPTAYVTPPIDPQFTLPARFNNRLPVVGVAGFVYESGRKGEELVRRLMKSPLMKSIELRAAGSGWPCETKLLDYGDLPAFYGSLDVLLCSSLTEGPGYPPLEALACGAQVVVPYEVGIFDELPDLPGIHRYERGAYDDMERALHKALRTKANPAALRNAVGDYTAEAWTEDHKQAFKGLLCPLPPPPKRAPAWSGDNAGVYMVAYGDPARKCAETAIASWHRHMPGVPVCLVSDASLGPEDVFVEEPDRDVGARGVKTRIYDLAPEAWRYVVYVDADTEVTADVSFLFDLLVDGWEIFICYNPEAYVLGRNMIRPDNGDECEETFTQVGTDEFIQMNGGVFGFRRCPRTANFFRRWHEEWQRWGKRDQAAFDRVLYDEPLRLYTLGVEFNTITRYFEAERSAGILHYPTRARRHEGIIEGRLDSPEAWRKAGLK